MCCRYNFLHISMLQECMLSPNALDLCHLFSFIVNPWCDSPLRHSIHSIPSYTAHFVILKQLGEI